MKRLSICLVLVLLITALGNAQLGRGLEISLSSGYVIPSSPMTFNELWKMQYGGGIQVGYALSSDITIIGSVEYYKFKLNESEINNKFNAQYMKTIWVYNDVKINALADPSSITAASANIRFAPSGRTGLISPYFVAGVGVMRFSLSEIPIKITNVLSTDNSTLTYSSNEKITGGTETAGMMQGGFGIDLCITNSFRPFIEARYVMGLAKGVGTRYIPVTAGINIRL